MGTQPDVAQERAHTLPRVTSAGSAATVLKLAKDDGGDLSDAEKQAIIIAVREGKLVKVRFDACVYVQRSSPNRNFVRFAVKALKALAASFKNKPFLRDHSQHSVLARGGTIVESKLEADGADYKIVQTVELTEPWAIEGVLRGTIDRFSIGFEPTGPVVCSACECAYKESWWGQYPACDHYPGDTVTKKSGDEVCEAVFTSAAGVETSGVVIPAVDGTEIDRVKAAMSAARANVLQQLSHAGGARLHSKETGMDFKAKIAMLLGLSALATASDDEVIAAIERVKLAHDAEKETHAATKVALSTLQTALATREAAELDAAIDQHVERAFREGRLAMKHGPDGKRAAGAVELAIRAIGKGPNGLAAAKEYVDALPRLLPVGTAPAALGTEPKKSGAPGAEVEFAGDDYGLTAVELRVAQQMGLSAKVFADEKVRIAEQARKESRVAH